MGTRFRGKVPNPRKGCHATGAEIEVKKQKRVASDEVELQGKTRGKVGAEEKGGFFP